MSLLAQGLNPSPKYELSFFTSYKKILMFYPHRKKQKPLVPYEQQHHYRVWTMDNDAHRNVELYMRRLVLQLSDIAVYVSEGLEIDKDRLQQFWNEDKISAESNLLQRIIVRKECRI